MGYSEREREGTCLAWKINSTDSTINVEEWIKPWYCHSIIYQQFAWGMHPTIWSSAPHKERWIKHGGHSKIILNVIIGPLKICTVYWYLIQSNNTYKMSLKVSPLEYIDKYHKQFMVTGLIQSTERDSFVTFSFHLFRIWWWISLP